MSEPGSPENPNRPVVPKKLMGINDSDNDIRDLVDRHVHKSEYRQGKGLLGRIFGKKVTTFEYDEKGMIEETRPPSIFRHKGHEPPPLEEGRFVTDRHGNRKKVE